MSMAMGQRNKKTLLIFKKYFFVNFFGWVYRNTKIKGKNKNRPFCFFKKYFFVNFSEWIYRNTKLKGKDKKRLIKQIMTKTNLTNKNIEYKLIRCFGFCW